jgi:transcriptional regulator with XRE-family HTH domain
MRRAAGIASDADLGIRMDNKIDLLLGRRLRMRRRMMGLTQNQLAAMVGVRFQQIQKYEAGANRISAARLWGFCQALEVPAAYFFDGLPSARRPEEGERADDLMDRAESLDLIHAFRQLGERPRRKLLDLARALSRPMDAA